MTRRSKNYKGRKKIRDWYRKLKMTLVCSKCGDDRHYLLEWHHRDPDTKEFMVSRAAHDSTNKEKVLKEMDKCDVLCSNCHREVHYWLDK
jgi:hypothetical protein